MKKLVFSLDDLFTACSVLKSRRRFTPGFDKMTPEAAETWLKINGDQLCHQLNSGKYHVLPASGFYMAKADGSYRRLARLCAIDTVIQLALSEKLESFCSENYSQYSFAYQKGLGTGTALKKYCDYGSVHPYAGKIDPKACFDNINHSILEEALNSFFFNHKLVMLLMDFARMPVIIEGQLTDRTKGILQGAPISGMLCNIYFHSLDYVLEKKQIPFLRYADDIVVFADSPARAKESTDFVSDYIENHLHLKVNSRKLTIDASEKIKYLGHRFIRDKKGMICIDSEDKSAAAYYAWNREHPVNPRNSIDILSDGILRQKDFSAVFESETGRSHLPLDTIERINIFSSVIFDTGFLEKALNAGVYVNIFSRDYDFKGRFVPFGALKDQLLIFEQLTAYNDEKSRIQLAREFDLASVHNLRLNIRYYNKQGESAVFINALSSINAIYQKMKQCTDYTQLLMLEAQVRSLYYSCYDSFIKNKDFSFDSRSRRPPLNEVNALLSFGNAVLYNYIATELYKSSLDIRIGFLHASNKRLESLNLDIAEIFKPLVVDRVVFSLINRNEINLSCFETADDNGVYLNENGKRIYLRSFYEKLGSTLRIKDQSFSYAMLINAEIQKLTRRFRKGERYKAYRQVR